MPMKELIAAAHTRRFSHSSSFIDSFLCSNGVPEPSVNVPSLKEGSSGQCSPSNHTIRFAADRIHTQQNSGAIPFDNMQQKGLNKLSGHDEASSARRAFEAFLGSLTRTKESIGRATRLALECDKQGIAGEVRPCTYLFILNFSLQAYCSGLDYIGFYVFAHVFHFLQPSLLDYKLYCW